MKLRSMRIESSPKLMIIPMIDIIFFLLVFFMLSSLQMVHQKTLPVQLPKASTAVRSQEAVAVTLSAEETLFLEDRPVALLDIQREIASRKQQDRDLMVILRADQSVAHGKVVEVMDGLKAAGVDKLAVAVGEGGR